MAKRKLTKQQTKRIKNQQDAYHQASDPALDGLVITRFSRDALVEDQNGILTQCSIRPNIDTLVAGDRVVWQKQSDDHGVVMSYYPRTSVLTRISKNAKKPIAANITQVVVVIAPKPEISWLLLDSYLVMIEHLQLTPLILLNKTDLPCDDIKAQLKQCYLPLGYSIIETSHSHQDSSALEKKLAFEVNIFVGQSGVGKSTLIAQLLDLEDTIKTGKISDKAELGQHTTSNAYYYHLKQGGAIIDSPGIRSLELGHLSINELIKGFREFKPFLGHCQFRNCNHINDKGCAIIEAVKNGQVDAGRYERFVRLCA